VHRRCWVAGLVLLLALSGCARTADPGGPAATDPLDPSLVSASYDGRFRTVVGVLESPEHGPQLCSTGGADIYPPQCGGPDIEGWDWSTVDAESARGTTWGSYRITGTWDGATFTLTEPAVADTGTSEPDREYDFSAPCPEPAGGWPPFPADLAADPPAYEAAKAAVHELPDVSGTWVDQGGTAADLTPVPGRYVLVVRTTGDVPTMEAAVRDIWPGRSAWSVGPGTPRPRGGPSRTSCAPSLACSWRPSMWSTTTWSSPPTSPPSSGNGSWTSATAWALSGRSRCSNRWTDPTSCL